MSKALSEAQINEALENLDGWNFEDNKLKKEFSFDDFRAAVAFIMRLSFEAEDEVHHPEIFNVYNTVHISLSTHDAGGNVTEKDVTLARKIDKL